MTEWDKQRLEELVRKMKLQRALGQGKSPIHLTLYGCLPYTPAPLLTQIMRLDANAWVALGYDETDRVSVVRYLGSLKCRTDYALTTALQYQHPLTLELAETLIDAGGIDKYALVLAVRYQQPPTLDLMKLLIDSGCDPSVQDLYGRDVLWAAAQYQQPLTLELTKALTSTGRDPAAQDGCGWDALVWLACGGHPVDPQVTDLFLSAGCRTDLNECTWIEDEHRLRFDRILKEHAEWKLGRECVATSTSYGPDWGR